MRRIAASYVFKYVPAIRRLVFQEVYERTEEKPAEGAAPVEEAPAQKEAQSQRSSADEESTDQKPAGEPASAPKSGRTRKKSGQGSQATPNSSTSEQA